MTMLRSACRSLAVAGLTSVPALVLLAGCAQPADLSPVPTEASGPYACDGVPWRGPELILGGPVEVKFAGQPGTRVNDELFRCTFESDDGYLVVKDELLTASAEFGRDEVSVVRFLESVRNSEPVEADFPGQGFTVGSTAVWVCNGRVVIVRLIDRPTDSKRDARQDTTNLLLSQLPFVCEGVDMPAADGPRQG